MTKINLLPWRENLREERKRQFLTTLTASAIFAILIMVLVHLAVANKIGSQQSRNRFLEQEVQLLNKKISEIKILKERKAALLARMAIIQELQGDRSKVVRLFDEIVNVLPKGVHLVTIERRDDFILLEGKAESNTNVSNLMRNIDKSPWLARSMLSEIKSGSKDSKHVNDFKLQLSLIKPLGL